MSPFADWLSLRHAPPPGAAIELAGRHVRAASLEMRGGRPTVVAHATESLPDWGLVPSLTASNIHDKAAVAAAVGKVLERVGSPRRVGLVIPDPVAKVSLIRFEHVPAKTQDLDQLIRWQVR